MSSLTQVYEQEFARGTEAPHAVAFTFARTALAAILRAAGLQPGDGVLLSPLTCKVVPLAILGAGFRPIYADVRRDTLNLDAGAVDAARMRDVRAILFQRTYGNAAGAEDAQNLARTAGLPLIEDCAQCMPGPGTWLGDAAIFSNNPGKPLPAGSGGMAVMRDAKLAEAVAAARDELPHSSAPSAWRTRGATWIRNRVLSGALYWPAFTLTQKFAASYSPRPLASEIADELESVAGQIHDSQARAGRAWLGRADRISERRRELCRRYAEALACVPGLERPCPGEAPLYWFPVLVPRKPELLETARRARVEIVPWPRRAPIYPLLNVADLRPYGYEAGSCPVAENVASRLVGLPTHPLVSDADADRVIMVIKRHIGAAA